jgi:hypothetical protein
MSGVVVADEKLGRRTHALGDRVENGLLRGEQRLLRHRGQPKARGLPDLAVVGPRDLLDHAQEARLAGSVAPDEPHVLAVLDDEIDAVEQGNVAVCERGGRELEQRQSSPA